MAKVTYKLELLISKNYHTKIKYVKLQHGG